MAFCPNCGNQIPAGATACPNCAGAAQPAAAPAAAASGLTDNVAGMLAYLTIIPAIIFLVMEPYNKNRFVRFHAFQCLFVAAALFAVGIALSIVGSIPLVGLIVIPIAFVLWIGTIILAIILMMKAYQGQKFKLPVIGDMAEKQANA